MAKQTTKKSITMSREQWAVEHSANEAVERISHVLKEGVEAIAQAAQNAKQVVANSSADAAKVLVAKQTDGGSDHDTIVKLVAAVEAMDKNNSEKFRDLKTDIKDIKDGTATTIERLKAEKLDVKDSYPVVYQKNVEDSLSKLWVQTGNNSTNITRILAISGAMWALVGIGISLLAIYKH